ncbi:MAG: hypothetical protein AAGA83_27460, partial [Cyanobacteria bacterium P01_F01_bin.116]
RQRGYAAGFPSFHEKTIQGQKIYGAQLLKAAAVEWRDVPATEIGGFSDTAARFRNVYDYAHKNGFVGGFPNFHQANYGQGVVYGTLLLKPVAAQWRDTPMAALASTPAWS